ncbi:MAG: Trk system potassium transporter TrkA [Eubacteriales bacterium]|nr:Trk system potassium transporter TrkA [Eubacteriales bacterium]
MNIVIMGGGKIGRLLCKEFSDSEHNVTLVDEDSEVVEDLLDRYDMNAVLGNGATYNTLMEAGIAEADIFIAVADRDEINLVAAVICQQLSDAFTIARVRNPEYGKHLKWMREGFGVNLLINPDMEAAHYIARNLNFPAAKAVESFAHGHVNIVAVEVAASSKIVGLSLMQVRQKRANVLICAIERQNQVVIPNGATRIEAGDILHLTGPLVEMNRFYHLLGVDSDRIDSVLVIGGNRITYYLISYLLPQHFRIKVIERDPAIAMRLADQYPEVTVILGDGTDQNILAEERRESYDCEISLTGIDEENIVAALLAERAGVRKVMTKVSRPEMVDEIGGLGLQSVINPQLISRDIILRHVRALQNSQGSKVEALYRLFNKKAELLQFCVEEGAAICGISLHSLALKPGVLIAYIIRKGSVIYPDGSNAIYPDDRVIVVTTVLGCSDIDELLKN